MIAPDYCAQREFRCLEARVCVDGVMIGFEGDEPDGYGQRTNTFDSCADASKARVLASQSLLKLKEFF